MSDEPEYVVVDNLPSLLSDDKKDLLTQQLPPSQDILEEGWMISTFAIAFTRLHYDLDVMYILAKSGIMIHNGCMCMDRCYYAHLETENHLNL